GVAGDVHEPGAGDRLRQIGRAGEGGVQAGQDGPPTRVRNGRRHQGFFRQDDPTRGHRFVPGSVVDDAAGGRRLGGRLILARRIAEFVPCSSPPSPSSPTAVSPRTTWTCVSRRSCAGGGKGG